MIYVILIMLKSYLILCHTNKWNVDGSDYKVIKC